MSSPELSRDENIRKLAEMIKGIEFAMLTTAEPDGSLRSRPMATQKAEFDGDLYFFTYGSSPKAHEIEHDRHVNVSYANPDKQRYVSVSGRARITRDRARMEELWTPELKAWFPQGLDEPDIALLQVSVEKAEYWDSPSSLVAHAISFVKAMVTGQPAQPGDHEKIDLK